MKLNTSPSAAPSAERSALASSNRASVLSSMLPRLPLNFAGDRRKTFSSAAEPCSNSYSPTSLHQLHDRNHQRDEQQDVQQAAQRVRRGQPKRPQHEQYQN